jgi:hypothetical protein
VAVLPVQVDGNRVTFDKEAGLWTVGSADGPDIVGRVLVSGACLAFHAGCAGHFGQWACCLLRWCTHLVSVTARVQAPSTTGRLSHVATRRSVQTAPPAGWLHTWATAQSRRAASAAAHSWRAAPTTPTLTVRRHPPG